MRTTETIIPVTHSRVATWSLRTQAGTPDGELEPMMETSSSELRADSPENSGIEAQFGEDDSADVFVVRGLRGYTIQLEHIRRMLDDEDVDVGSLFLVDNSELSVPLTSDEIGQLVGLVWKYKNRLESCSVAWVSSQPCVLESRLRAELPITLRHFRSHESAKAWLASRS